jgi:hypothetical protein
VIFFSHFNVFYYCNNIHIATKLKVRTIKHVIEGKKPIAYFFSFIKLKAQRSCVIKIEIGFGVITNIQDIMHEAIIFNSHL